MPKNEPKIRLLIADDHEIVRRGLRAIFDLEDAFEVVDEAKDGEEAKRKAEDVIPDVVLMDLRMPKMDGIAATRAIKSFAPQIQILALTTFDDKEEIVESIKAGISGYLLKSALPEELIKAVSEVHEGRSLLDPTVTRKLLDQLSVISQDYVDKGKKKLSPREKEILNLIARGLSNREIAAELWISEKTVKTHVSSILSKLEQPNRAQAVLCAIRKGLFKIDKEYKTQGEKGPTQNASRD